MPLGQGWLNAWVKVNSKHVVFPPNSKNDRESEKDDVLNKAIGKNQKGSKTNSSVTTARTAATGTSEDAETQAMRRFHHRKHRRRLQRTVSASDLLRDKAKGKVEKGDKKAKDEEAVLDKSSSSHVSSSHKVVPVSSQSDTHEKALPNLPQHEDRSIVSGETEKSLSFVAGFFGADIESLDAGAAHHPKFTHSASFHDAASVQVIGHHSRLDAGSVISRGGQSLPARPIYSLPRSDSSESSSSKGGGLGIRFPPNLFAGDNNSKAGCRQCSKLEGELLASQEDLEYLRSMALRSEYMCATCQTEPSKKIHTHVSPEAGDGAQILNEATERHKAQIETLIQERVSMKNLSPQSCSHMSNLFDCSLFHRLDGNRKRMSRSRSMLACVKISTRKPPSEMKRPLSYTKTWMQCGQNAMIWQRNLRKRGRLLHDTRKASKSGRNPSSYCNNMS